MFFKIDKWIGDFVEYLSQSVQLKFRINCFWQARILIFLASAGSFAAGFLPLPINLPHAIINLIPNLPKSVAATASAFYFLSLISWAIINFFMIAFVGRNTKSYFSIHASNPHKILYFKMRITALFVFTFAFGFCLGLGVLNAASFLLWISPLAGQCVVLYLISANPLKIAWLNEWIDRRLA